VKIRRWQPYRNSAGSVCGFLDEQLPSGLIVNGCRLMVGANRKHWIALPAQAQTNRDGSAKLDASGKNLWAQIIEFADRAAADRLRDDVLDALRRQHPGALDGGGHQ
jgi:hypothetical protein